MATRSNPSDAARWMGALLAACAMALGAPARTQPAQAAAVVTMSDQLHFVPSTVRIRAGETVVWRNTSRLAHTVTDDPHRALHRSDTRLPRGAAPFDSGNLAPGQSFAHAFSVPGTYRYVCVPHEASKMIGTVVVLPRR